MSKQTLDAPLTLSTDNGSASPFTTLDDFFSAVPRPQETAVIGGRRSHFEGMSAEAKDRLIALPLARRRRGQRLGREQAVAHERHRLTWVKSFGGAARARQDHEDIDRFYKNPRADRAGRCTRSPRASRDWATWRSAEKTPAPMVVRQRRVRSGPPSPHAAARGDGAKSTARRMPGGAAELDELMDLFAVWERAAQKPKARATAA
jgi:hypothetical protein